MRQALPIIIVAAAVVVLGYFITTAALELKHNRTSLDAGLARVAANLNQRLPLMTDENTRLDKVTAGPGMQLTYAFTITNLDKSTIDREFFEQTIRSNMISNYKTNDQMSDLRAGQVKLNYQYKDKNGELFSQVIVTPKDF